MTLNCSYGFVVPFIIETTSRYPILESVVCIANIDPTSINPSLFVPALISRRVVSFGAKFKTLFKVDVKRICPGGPVIPVAPVAPVAPVGPVHPVDPVTPV